MIDKSSIVTARSRTRPIHWKYTVIS